MFNTTLLSLIMLAAPFTGSWEDQNVSFRLPIPEKDAWIISWFSHGDKKYSCECNGSSCRSGHRGTDLPAVEGTPVFAAATGEVIAAVSGCVVGNTDCGGGFGNFVRIRHLNGVKTVYAHLSKTLASVGDMVSCGDKIGEVGNTGHSQGNHLHFEVETPGGDDLDPFGGPCNPASDEHLWTHVVDGMPTPECGEDPDKNQNWIGGACDTSPHCSFSQAICLSDWPAGTCSAACDKFCPDRDGPIYAVTFCIDVGGVGRCVSRCDKELYPGSGCREGYVCEKRERFNDSTSEQEVCVPAPTPDPDPLPEPEPEPEPDVQTPDLPTPEVISVQPDTATPADTASDSSGQPGSSAGCQQGGTKLPSPLFLLLIVAGFALTRRRRITLKG